MSRWVDVEWLMKYFKRGKEYKGEYVLDDLKHDAPNIDIVRCGECRYWGTYGTWSECELWAGDPYESAQTEADDYCSYGERGDGND